MDVSRNATPWKVFYVTVHVHWNRTDLLQLSSEMSVYYVEANPRGFVRSDSLANALSSNGYFSAEFEKNPFVSALELRQFDATGVSNEYKCCAVIVKEESKYIGIDQYIGGFFLLDDAMRSEFHITLDLLPLSSGIPVVCRLASSSALYDRPPAPFQHALTNTPYNVSHFQTQSSAVPPDMTTGSTIPLQYNDTYSSNGQIPTNFADPQTFLSNTSELILPSSLPLDQSFPDIGSFTQSHYHDALFGAQTTENLDPTSEQVISPPGGGYTTGNKPNTKSRRPRIITQMFHAARHTTPGAIQLRPVVMPAVDIWVCSMVQGRYTLRKGPQFELPASAAQLELPEDLNPGGEFRTGLYLACRDNKNQPYLRHVGDEEATGTAKHWIATRSGNGYLLRRADSLSSTLGAGPSSRHDVTPLDRKEGVILTVDDIMGTEAATDDLPIHPTNSMSTVPSQTVGSTETRTALAKTKTKPKVTGKTTTKKKTKQGNAADASTIAAPTPPDPGAPASRGRQKRKDAGPSTEHVSLPSNAQRSQASREKEVVKSNATASTAIPASNRSLSPVSFFAGNATNNLHNASSSRSSGRRVIDLGGLALPPHPDVISLASSLVPPNPGYNNSQGNGTEISSSSSDVPGAYHLSTATELEFLPSGTIDAPLIPRSHSSSASALNPALNTSTGSVSVASKKRNRDEEDGLGDERDEASSHKKARIDDKDEDEDDEYDPLFDGDLDDGDESVPMGAPMRGPGLDDGDDVDGDLFSSRPYRSSDLDEFMKAP